MSSCYLPLGAVCPFCSRSWRVVGRAARHCSSSARCPVGRCCWCAESGHALGGSPPAGIAGPGPVRSHTAGCHWSWSNGRARCWHGRGPDAIPRSWRNVGCVQGVWKSRAALQGNPQWFAPLGKPEWTRYHRRLIKLAMKEKDSCKKPHKI